MNNEMGYEIRGGVVKTPERGNVEIPPERTVRKDIIEGNLVITSEPTPPNVQVIVSAAKKSGITEIPSRRLSQRDEGR